MEEIILDPKYKLPQKILIVSFNSRPIVQSALNMKLDVNAVDYWGDQDLKSLTNNLIVVNKKETQNRMDKAELLVKAATDAFKKFINIDGILIGSGLDDRVDLWEKLNHLAPIFGNPPSVIKNARDILHLFKIAKKRDIACPNTQLISSITEVKEILNGINFPIVLKPFGGAGGVNIRIAKNKEELKLKYIEIEKNTKDKRVYMQEFIDGIDVSSMTLSNGKLSRVLSINEQLIGLKEVNSPSPFSYCGNIIPLDSTNAVFQKITEYSEKLANYLGLKGINGIDFVLKGTTPYLMEINPRFPGTFELVENVLETNLLDLHLKACQGELPIQSYKYKKYGAKYVIFSNGHYKLPELSHIKEIHDISFPGTEVFKGSPICSVLTFGANKEEVQRKGLQKINEIYTHCKQKP